MQNQRSVTYAFMIRPYIPYRLRNLPQTDRLYDYTIDYRESKPIEVRGQKTFKLFASWFKLMKRKGRLLYGVVTFDQTGETYIWQEKTVDKYGNKRGGWQLALRSEADRRKPEQLSLF